MACGSIAHMHFVSLHRHHFILIILRLTINIEYLHTPGNIKCVSRSKIAYMQQSVVPLHNESHFNVTFNEFKHLSIMGHVIIWYVWQSQESGFDLNFRFPAWIRYFRSDHFIAARTWYILIGTEWMSVARSPIKLNYLFRRQFLVHC